MSLALHTPACDCNNWGILHPIIRPRPCCAQRLPPHSTSTRRRVLHDGGHVGPCVWSSCRSWCKDSCQDAYQAAVRACRGCVFASSSPSPHTATHATAAAHAAAVRVLLAWSGAADAVVCSIIGLMNAASPLCASCVCAFAGCAAAIVCAAVVVLVLQHSEARCCEEDVVGHIPKPPAQNTTASGAKGDRVRRRDSRDVLLRREVGDSLASRCCNARHGCLLN